MSNVEGLDIDAITREAQEFVASLSEAEVKRRLTNKREKEDKKKLKAAQKKAMEKAIAKALEERGAKVDEAE